MLLVAVGSLEFGVGNKIQLNLDEDAFWSSKNQGYFLILGYSKLGKFFEFMKKNQMIFRRFLNAKCTR